MGAVTLASFQGLNGVHLLATTLPDALVFAVAAVMVLAGAIGVVVSRNPVHSALMLVLTLFGVAVEFVAQDAQFLAAVQVIVYAGAIVVLFLFVITLLGVDNPENLKEEPLRFQRPLALALAGAGATGMLLLGWGAKWTTGAQSVVGQARGHGPNVSVLGRVVFTTYLLPFEATSLLLVIAVVGAVMLVRHRGDAGADRSVRESAPASEESPGVVQQDPQRETDESDRVPAGGPRATDQAQRKNAQTNGGEPAS